MPSDQAIHVATAAIAAFVGGFQLLFRWSWSNYLTGLDRWALRAWAISTTITAAAVAITLFYFRRAPVDQWFLLVALVVVAKAAASIVSFLALREHIRREGHPR